MRRAIFRVRRTRGTAAYRVRRTSGNDSPGRAMYQRVRRPTGASLRVMLIRVRECAGWVMQFNPFVDICGIRGY